MKRISEVKINEAYESWADYIDDDGDTRAAAQQVADAQLEADEEEHDKEVQEIFKEIEKHRGIVSHNIFPPREAYVITDETMQALKDRRLKK